MFAATFCTPLQQSFAQSSNRDLVNREIPDSDSFFREMTRKPKPPRDNTARVEALLRKMTLEEKVGQMTQLAIDQVTSGSRPERFRLIQTKLQKAIGKYGVGSILNVNGQALTVDRWHEIIGAIQNESMKTRLQIPNIYGIDSIHGAGYVQRRNDVSPGNRNGGNLESGFDAAGGGNYRDGNPRCRESRGVFRRCLILGGSRSGRGFWETFGEDPYLASVMGASFVRGLEGDDIADEKHVAASLKHYMGYSLPAFRARPHSRADS